MVERSKTSLRAEVEREMAAEAREEKKTAIKSCLRRIIDLEQKGEADKEANKAEIAKINKEIADIEAGKLAFTAYGFAKVTHKKGYSQYLGSNISMRTLLDAFNAAGYREDEKTPGKFKSYAQTQGYDVS